MTGPASEDRTPKCPVLARKPRIFVHLKVNYLIGVVMWGEINGKNHNLEKKKYYIMKLPTVRVHHMVAAVALLVQGGSAAECSTACSDEFPACIDFTKSYSV